MDVPVLADQQESTYNISVRTQDVVWKTCREQWMIGTDGEKERERERERERVRKIHASSATFLGSHVGRSVAHLVFPAKRSQTDFVIVIKKRLIDCISHETTS